jgi:hypothetical protein
MKQVKFKVGTKYVGSDVEEIIDFEDDITTEEIETTLDEWINENIKASWDYV